MNNRDRTRQLDEMARKVDELRDIARGLIAARRLALAQTSAGDTVQAANLEAIGSHGQASDPTGLAVVAHDPTDTLTRLAVWDAQLAEASDHLVDVADGVGRVLYGIARRYEPPAEQPAFRWCESCSRFGIDEHVAVGRYAKFCRPCGDWRAAHAGTNPPRMVVEACHAGRKITTRLVEKARLAESRGR